MSKSTSEPGGDPQTYALTFTRTQLAVVSRACDLFSRIQAGQLRAVLDAAPWRSPDDVVALREALVAATPLVTGMDSHAYPALHSEAVPETARIAADIHEVARHRLAWDRKPEGNPISVHFDAPMHWSTHEHLPGCTRVPSARGRDPLNGRTG